MKSYVATIRDAFAKADPDGAAEYEANAAAYTAQLDELNAWIESQVALVPAADRKLVMNHASHGYFADRYGFSVVGTVIPSVGTGETPTAKQLSDLTAAIRTSGAKAIFVEIEENPKLAEQIAAETGIAVVDDLLDHSLTAAGRRGADVHRHDDVRHAEDRRGAQVIVDDSTPSASYLAIDDATVSYNGRAALDAVTMHVPHGAQVAIVGPNGAGKSTLFKALVGLLPLRNGRVLLHGRAPGSQADPIAYVPQREEIDWGFPVTVSDVVMMGRYGRMGWLRRPQAADREVVARALDELGIAELAGRAIGELSGGQQQRVFLARALAQEPHVLLLDEPFTGVDVNAKETILGLLARLRERHITVLVSTHDMQTAADRFELVALLNGRLVAYGPPTEVFTQEHISAAFGGQALFLDGMVVIDQCCPGHVGDGEQHRHSHEPHAGPR